VRRLYSTFARGPPGVGLLLIRLVAGITAIVHGFGLPHSGPELESVLVVGLHIVLGVLLVVGLWTPVAGTLLALLAFADAYVHAESRWYCIVVGTMGAALALIGPGMWSIDARLFGWKRLEIRDRKSPRPPS
jgi:putative oxidoreductase